jgi:transcriptional regulator GlxA family with amidase domain
MATVARAAVAEAVQMSYYHFSRAFRQSMGASPHVCMIGKRINWARR